MKEQGLPPEAERQGLRERPGSREDRVGGVHDPLRFARGAGGELQFGEVVGSDWLGAQPLGWRLVLPAAMQEVRLEGLDPPTGGVDADREPSGAGREVGENPVEHRGVVVAPKGAGDDDHRRLGPADDEAELAFTEDRHQRVDDGADATAGQGEGGEEPVVGQLHRHDLAGLDTEVEQGPGEPVDVAGELSVADRARMARVVVTIGGDGDLVRHRPYGVVEIVEVGPVPPPALGPEVGRQRRIDQPGCSPVCLAHDVHPLPPGSRAAADSTPRR